MGCARRAAGMALMMLALTAPAARLAAEQNANAPPKGSGAPLNAEQILAKNVAARGGLAAWRQVKTMVWLGHLESERAPLPSMGFILEQARPNKTRFQLIAHNARTVRVFNGREGWKSRPGRADVEPYSREELAFAASAPGIDGPLIDSAAKGSKVRLEGTEPIEGHPAYRLALRLPSGEQDHVWVDAKSFLEVRYDRPVPGAADATRTVSVYYLEYATTAGLKIPALIRTATAVGGSPDRMVIERVVVNAPLEERIFGNPATERAAANAMRPPPSGTPQPPASPAAAESPGGTPPQQ